MKLNLLKYMECKACKVEYEAQATEKAGQEIMSGRLRCPKCGREVPILKGVPRFIEGMHSEEDLRKVYADSFGHQWTTYNWLREEDEFEFYQVTDFKPEDLKGKLVFDAGCGGGRFARIAAQHAGELIGLDFSIAIDKAFELVGTKPNCHLVQCDINQHPFKENIFDVVYSHGVLHHTPDTKKSFLNLPPLVKPGGTLYVAIFKHTFAPMQWSDRALRGIMNKLPIPVLDKVCGAMAYLYYLPAPLFWKRFFWFSMQDTHEIRKCCLYDWYGPTYHHEHKVEELMAWFTEAGYSDLKYINAWPYCAPENKYRIPTVKDSFRLGQHFGIVGKRKPGRSEQMRGAAAR